jgi:hypothetical protein
MSPTVWNTQCRGVPPEQGWVIRIWTHKLSNQLAVLVRSAFIKRRKLTPVLGFCRECKDYKGQLRLRCQSGHLPVPVGTTSGGKIEHTLAVLRERHILGGSPVVIPKVNNDSGDVGSFRDAVNGLMSHKDCWIRRGRGRRALSGSAWYGESQRVSQ